MGFGGLGVEMRPRYWGFDEATRCQSLDVLSRGSFLHYLKVVWRGCGEASCDSINSDIHLQTYFKRSMRASDAICELFRG